MEVELFRHFTIAQSVPRLSDGRRHNPSSFRGYECRFKHLAPFHRPSPPRLSDCLRRHNPSFGVYAGRENSGYECGVEHLTFPLSDCRRIRTAWLPVYCGSSGIFESESHDSTLERVRNHLMKLEDKIIISLVHRSRLGYDSRLYDTSDGLTVTEQMMRDSERSRARFGAFMNEARRPFFSSDLLGHMVYPSPRFLQAGADDVNINSQIWEMYRGHLLPSLGMESGVADVVATADCDVRGLQVISERIHLGLFVAESKFRASPDIYKTAILTKDQDKVLDLLTYPEVEEKVKQRVVAKARDYEKGEMPGKVASMVSNLFGEWIMPLTKEVQVKYLLTRMDGVSE